MLQANEYLANIFQVLVKIDNKLSKSESSKSSEGKDTGIIKSLALSLKDLASNPEKIKETTKNLSALFDVLINFGKKEKEIKNIINLFDSLNKGFKEISNVAKNIGFLFLGIGGAIVLIAGSFFLGAKLLGVAGPIAVLGIIALTFLTLAGIFLILHQAEKSVQKGVDIAKDMGKALMFIAGGVLAFVISLQFIASIMKIGNDAKSMLLASAVVVGVVMAFAGIFALINLIPGVKEGAMAAKSIGLGLVFLAGGILAMVGVAYIISKMTNPLKNVLIAVGMLAAVIGIFALIGIPAVAALVGLGAIVAIGVALSLILFAVAVKKLMKISEELKDKDVKKNISTLVGGVLGGLVEGVTEALTGGKKGLGGFLTAIKNSAILFAGIAMLMGVSMALSMFAYAMSAFVDLGNMKVIEGYDKDGKPKFGPTVNIEGVGQTITKTITNFLVNLLDSTENLTKKKAGAIRKMSRALTGRRGIMSAVIGFAEALKVFAEFGPSGQIGSIEYIDSGKKDEDGNIIYNTKRISVPIDTVVNYMVGSFTTFIDRLADHVDSFYKLAKDKSVKRVAKALTGKRGILSAVIGFSEALQMYSKYGEKNEIPILDADGNPTGKSLKMQQVAENIVLSLSTFSEVLANAIDKDDKKNARQAKTTLRRFDDLIDQFNKLAKAQEGLEKVASTIGLLAQNIGLLSTNLGTLDTSKLSTITGTIAKGNYIADKASTSKSGGSSTTNIYNTSNTPSISPTSSGKTPDQPNWEEIAKIIGAQVASALGNKQFKFEFATDKSGVLMMGQ